MQGDTERMTYSQQLRFESSRNFTEELQATFTRYGHMVCALFIKEAMKDFMSNLMYASAFERRTCFAPLTEGMGDGGEASIHIHKIKIGAYSILDYVHG